ncbi:MAG: hypothetical protein DKT66_24315 [Candidatus Melainabacteria bacterium]|nr:MAG: hypothetical protein DKT66_24315 [Candidatus Melainabacteria bacterium]
MKNPFRYGGIVRADAFCNRKNELDLVRRSMENSDNLFMYSERRLGKSSLVLQALSELPKSDYKYAYVDLWPTNSEADFIGVFARTITEAFSSTPQKMFEFSKQFFGSLRPVMSLDDTGKPQIGFGVAKDNPSAYSFDNILEVPQTAAIKFKTKVVVVLDEFQQVLSYESDTAERRLRSAIQKQDQVSYIFLGSRKHLIQQMLTDRSRPLYRAGAHFVLRAIEQKHWSPFISERFNRTLKSIDEECISRIVELTEGHPFYTQHLCNTLWELTDSNTPVLLSTVDEAVELLLDREDYAFSTLWESLTINQRKLLESFAFGDSGIKPFSAESIRLSGLKTASNVQRALQPLLEKDLIDQESGSYFVLDRFLRLWIRKKANRWHSS